MMDPTGALLTRPRLSFPSRTRAHFFNRQRPDFPHLTDTVLKDHRQKQPSQPHPDTPLTGGHRLISSSYPATLGPLSETCSQRQHNAECRCAPSCGPVTR